MNSTIKKIKKLQSSKNLKKILNKGTMEQLTVVNRYFK